MIRVSAARPSLKKRENEEAVFSAAPGTRLLAGALCAVLMAMFLVHQTQIEGASPLVRGAAAAAAAAFGALAWYFVRRGARRGPVLRVGPRGFGIALGFDGWLDVPWTEVEAFRYWEPTGIAMLIKRRQSRWVGVLLHNPRRLRDLAPSGRFEVWLNTFHNRPGLCVLHPFVAAPILEVLQAFKDHAPKELDDFGWMRR